MRVCVCVRVKLLKKKSFFFSIFIVIVAIAATAAASTTIVARIITILISYLYFVKRNQTFFLQSFINLTLGFKRGARFLFPASVVPSRNSADVLFR